MTSEGATRLEGMFWQIETPQRRVPGQLELGDGKMPVLETRGAIFDERAYTITVSQHGDTTIAQSGNPDDLIADFQPRNVHGELDDGRHVSLVEAQGHADPNSFMRREYRQNFRVRHAVMDERVDGAAQRYSGFRFRVDGSGWWRRPDEQAQTDDGSRLQLTWEDDSRLFEFHPATPLTFREFDPTVLSPITTLASLVTDNPAAEADMHVRLAADGPWRKVYQPEEPIGQTSHPLLYTTHLTAERFAKWIDIRKRTRGLDAAAITALDGIVIEAQVLTLTAVAEGLHRKLFDDSDRTFRSRMGDLIADAKASIPGIAVNFNDWAEAVKDARNTLAHEGTGPDDPTGQFVDLLIALGYSIPWVLRTVLVKQAGFDTDTLQAGYADSSRYSHHITNTRYLLAGGPYAASQTQALRA